MTAEVRATAALEDGRAASDSDGAVVHGGLQDDELLALGLSRDELVDLSANLHPSGPDPRVLEAARAAPLDRYPAPDAAPLRDAIAAHHGIDPSMVLVTAGATAAIHLLARVLAGPGSTGVLFPPTFGEYEAALTASGALVRHSCALETTFDIDPDGVAPADLGFLCQPNNPTGAVTSAEAIHRVIDALEGGTLVLDLAYEGFVDPAEVPLDAHALVRDGAPVVAMHSMTKLHAVPGLRLGYLVAAPATIARLAAAQPSWSIDAPAMAAGVVAITQTEARRALLDEMPATRESLREAFHALGCATGPGRANFLLAEVGNGAAVRGALMKRGFVVRDCASFGLPAWIRVAVPQPTIAARLIEALPGALTEVRP